MPRLVRTETLRVSLTIGTATVAVLLGGVLGGGTNRAVGAEAMPTAELVEPEGLSTKLRGAEGLQRVRILLADQPLLKASSKPSIQALIKAPDTDQLKPIARERTAVVSASEKREARLRERRFERASKRLVPAAHAALGSLESARRAVRRAGGTVLGADLVPASIVARLPATALPGLASSRAVQAILPSRRPRRLLDNATPSTGAPAWFAAGYSGGEGANDSVSVDVGLISESPEPSHPAFAGLSLEALGCCISDHGTHVGGVVASQDATFKGAAPGIDTLLGGSTARLLGFDDTSGDGANDPAEVLNLSFGSPADDDDNDDPDDLLVSLYDVGFSSAGGNENVDGSPTVNNIGRNQLSMAYYFDNNNTAASDDVISGASSNGPSPGGRKKPDLIAPGSQLIAPDKEWNTPPSNPDFSSVSGSSFSAPFGAAAMALLEGAAIGDSAAQRAILINSARDWNGQANNITHGWSPGSQGSWQPEVGWGALDLTQALADRGNYELASVGEGSARFFRASSSSGSKATLAWELRGTWENYPEPGSQPIAYTTSDLDLSQYRADSLSPITPPADPGHGGGPDAGDPNDTVEQVRAPSGGPQLIYKVKSSSTIVGLDAEPFAIAASEPLTPLVNPEVEPFALTSDASPSTSCSSAVEISATFRNDSPDLDATGASATLSLPAGVELLSGSQTQTVGGGGGTLAKGSTSETLTWSVRATSGGQKTLTIAGSGGTMGESFTATDEVSFTPDCTAPDTTITSGPSGLTNDTTPDFGFAANEPASFQCSVDDATFGGCSSPYSSESLPDGDHRLRVRAIDRAGNVEDTPASRSFTVDSTEPTATIAGPGLTKQKSPSFSLGSSEPGAFRCSIDGAGFSACGSPFRPSPLADGTHALQVRAVDLAGNIGLPVGKEFIVDTRVEDPDATAKKTQRQKGKQIKVKVKASAQEAVEVRGRGKIKLAGKDVVLKPVSKSIAGGEAVVLRLKPRRKSDVRRIFRALGNGRRVRSNPSVRFSDEAGNKTAERRTVRLR